MADNSTPTDPPAGRTRVPRFLDEAEQAAGSGGSLPPAAPPPAAPQSVNFFNGHVSTPELKAKQGKALQDMLKKRDQASADDDSDTTSA